MPNSLRNERHPTLGIREPPATGNQSEESLREQSRTETEERPYLDTLGGE